MVGHSPDRPQRHRRPGLIFLGTQRANERRVEEKRVEASELRSQAHVQSRRAEERRAFA
jgi:hypothetical protein